MNRSSIGRVVRVTIAVVLLVIASRVVALSAQATNPFDQVLAKLDEIIATVAPPAGPVRLATPTVNSTLLVNFYCVIANIGTESVEVLVSMRDAFGGLADGTPQPLLVVEPGRTEGIIKTLAPGAVRCEFEFNGTATSVRANLQYHTLDDPVASVDAR